MEIIVNGEPRQLSGSIPVSELIAALGLAERRLAVEVNRDIVSRDRYAEQILNDGDVVEIVQFVGGG